MELRLDHKDGIAAVYSEGGAGRAGRVDKADNSLILFDNDAGVAEKMTVWQKYTCMQTGGMRWILNLFEAVLAQK